MTAQQQKVLPFLIMACPQIGLYLNNLKLNKSMKAINLKPGSVAENLNILSAKLINQEGIDKVIIAAKDGIDNIVLSFTNEDGFFDQIIESMHEVGTPFFVEVEMIFNDLFNRLPRFIEENGVRYELGRFPAPGKGFDRVVYQEIDIETAVSGKLILVEAESPAMIRANSLMHAKLEELGFL